MKTIILAILVFFLAAPLLAQDNQGHDLLIENGDRHYEKFENLKALHEYEEAYKISPDSYEALTKLIRAQNDVGEDMDTDDAEEYFTTAIEHAKVLREKFPDKAETYFYLATSYGNLALFSGGKERVKLSRMIEENAKKSVELDPKDYRPYIILGSYYRQVANLGWLLKTFANSFFGGLPDGTNEDSERMYLKAIDLKQTDINANYGLARTYQKMGRTDEARKYLQKVIELPLADHLDKQYKSRAEERLLKLGKN